MRLQPPLAIKRILHTLRFADDGIDDLEDTDREGSSLTSTGLRLGNGIATFADLNNGTGLDSRRRLITISIDTTEKALLQVHVLEGRSNSDLLRGVELHAV